MCGRAGVRACWKRNTLTLCLTFTCRALLAVYLRLRFFSKHLQLIHLVSQASWARPRYGPPVPTLLSRAPDLELRLRSRGSTLDSMRGS